MQFMKRFIIIHIFLALFISLYAQQEMPDSRYLIGDSEMEYKTIFFSSQKENTGAKNGLALSAGGFYACNIDLFDCLKRDTASPSGIYRYGVFIENCKATGVVFNNFFIPKGLELFIYSPDYSDVQGPFSFDDVSERDFFMPPINGDSLIFEVNGSKNLLSTLNIVVSEFLVMDEPVYSIIEKGFGGSDDCEINVNCGEGNTWDLQKKAVVRILLRKGGQAYWCTGSLVNNTNNDYHPYLLTADHCGNGASEYDLQQWVFYFNYAFADCHTTAQEPARNTITGCRRVASGGSGGADGSDFYLVELMEEVPFSYEPFFCGWDRSLDRPYSGVTIHHPDGDVKKISTFHTPATSSQWSGNGVFSHWEVIWGDTENGHGVTEGGSSGAPLFNAQGFLTGTLTGGFAACEDGLYGPATGPYEPDYFGKFGYSWNQNGSLPTEQLAPWLDPQNLDPVICDGLYNSDVPVAAFSADTTVIIGETLIFEDQSHGAVETWSWYFEGGVPQTSDQQNPPGITYSAFGEYDVRLIAGNSIWCDTLLLRDYVKVLSNIYPVPASGVIHVHLGNDFSCSVEFDFYDSYGRMVCPAAIDKESVSDYTIRISNLPKGIYFVRMISGENTEVRKFMVMH